MGDNLNLVEKLVQLSRLAIGGNSREIEAYIRRLPKLLLKEYPEAAEKISMALPEGVATRSAANTSKPSAVHPVPIDAESRLDLLRIEENPSFTHPPLLSEQIQGQVDQIVLERESVTALAAAGLDPSRTVLFTGPPGVGKTLSARWIAKRLGKPLLSLDLASVMSSLLGKTGTNLKTVLDYAKSQDCVLLLDEFDAVAKRRNDDTEVGELKRLVTVILQEIDLWPSDRLLIAATNHGELLDPAVWRRFDVVIEFQNPSIAAVRSLVAQEVGEDVSPALIGALSSLYAGKSFSDVARQLRSLRRFALLADQPLQERIIDSMKVELQSASKSDLKKISVHLEQANLSQRQIAELTGLSRDTIRRARLSEEQDNG